MRQDGQWDVHPQPGGYALRAGSADRLPGSVYSWIIAPRAGAPPYRMRLLLDAHQLGRSQTGNETYVRELMRELRLMPELDVIAAVEAGQAPQGILAPPVRLCRVPRNGFGRLAALSVLN